MLSLPAVCIQVHVRAVFFLFVCFLCFLFGESLSTKRCGNYTYCKVGRNSAVFLSTVLSTVMRGCRGGRHFDGVLLAGR